jgi:hypothetical protein
LEIKIEVDLDEFTWGDLEDMESASPTKIRQVMAKFAQIEGVEPDGIGDYLRRLSLREMKEVSGQFQAAVTNATNPVGENGKN